jgi:hypothetical protein
VQEAEIPQGESVSVDGIVKRSSGRNTVWVNGRAQRENGSAAGGAAKLNYRDPAKASLANGDKPSVSLRVGESVNRTTGERKDGLGGGTIVIKRGIAAH